MAKEATVQASQQNPKQGDAVITVYWLNQSRSQRINWLLEELNLSYNVKVFKRGEDHLAPKELKDVHPLGKSPALGIKTPEMEREMVMAESGTITEYLVDHFGPELIPQRYPEGKENKIGAETPEYLRYKYYLHYAEGSLMPILVMAFVMKIIKTSPVPFFIKPITRGIATKVETMFINPNLKTHFTFLENELASSPNGGPFLCGDKITGSDILMSFPLEMVIAEKVITVDEYPKIANYVRSIHAREAYKRAVSKIEEIAGEKVGVDVPEQSDSKDKRRSKLA